MNRPTPPMEGAGRFPMHRIVRSVGRNMKEIALTNGKLTMFIFLLYLDIGGTPADLEKFYPWKVVRAKADKATRKGYMEYGLTYRYGWITEKGREKLDEYTSA